VQTSAAGMDPSTLKSRFGGPEEIRRHVRERMDIFKPGGGYVCTQVHNVQANVPPENIAAMLEAARDFGGY
jgi:uroporphyrinogen decarboxylase